MTYRFRDIRGHMAKIGVSEAKNGPREPLSWPRIWWPWKISPLKGENTPGTIVQYFYAAPVSVTVQKTELQKTICDKTHMRCICRIKK